MRTVPPLSKILFKPTNGKDPRTRDGWPVGKRLYPSKWHMVISPQAYTKLMTWHQGSHGLELSGHALLTERPTAQLDQAKIFYVDEIMLVCDIQERSYTEMTPEQRVQGMMWAHSKGRSANQLVWWHTHPVLGWLGTDVNTLRQRVHETGLPEVLQSFAFVLTPNGIRARWDQSGPDEKDNIYVDEIPVLVGAPSLLEVIGEAQAEVEKLLATREPATSQAIEMPSPSWQRPSWDIIYQSTMWDGWTECDPEEIYLYDLTYTEVAGAAITDALGEDEDLCEYVCRRDPDTLVSTDMCSTCPFMAGCFGLDLLQLGRELKQILDG
jgi:hypothetical protein